ncbi:probable fructokinase-6, chloroplastic [Hevea brasiliensis]|uniref:probable fructokinase-6, chloroplastic n=1 Tax=Hevea brasiliensis TaxID=3981 RepID=UPI0025DCAE1C|nr:probable fructokinase-6, chloroplastic [Hevea brasiliensis]
MTGNRNFRVNIADRKAGLISCMIIESLAMIVVPTSIMTKMSAEFFTYHYLPSGAKSQLLKLRLFSVSWRAKIFHYGSISLITEPCKSAHIAAAKDAGFLLSYDSNLRLWSSAESAREGVLSIWELADIIKVSEEEISFLTKGEDPYDDAVVRKLFRPNLKMLLVTEGADGCRYYTKVSEDICASWGPDAVDTTGAGDAFVGGILLQLVPLRIYDNEHRLRDALKFANALWCMTVKERGAIPALSTKEVVQNAILKSVAYIRFLQALDL